MSIQKSLLPIYKRLTVIGGAWYSSGNKKLLDLSGQTLNLSLGQPPSEIRQEVIKEIAKNTFFSSRFGSAAFEELANLLVKLAPNNVCCVNHKLSNGSDAVETAIKLSFENTRSTTIIVLQNAWHGETMATLSLSSKTRGKYLGSNLNIIFSSGPVIESLIEASYKVKRPSTVIIDPVGYSAGLFSKKEMASQLPELRRICIERGHFLIFDEIQCFGGFLGHDFFSFDIFGIESDAIAIGKAFGQGFPIAACLYDSKFAELLYNEAEFTHGGQPPACVAAISGLQYLLKKQGDIRKSSTLWNNCTDEIDNLIPKIQTKKNGFFYAITPNSIESVEKLLNKMMKYGLIGRKGNSLKSVMIKAPLIFNEEMKAWTISAFKKVAVELNDKVAVQNSRPIISIKNSALSYTKILCNRFSGITIYTRTVQEQYQLMLLLDNIGIPCPKVIMSDDGSLSRLIIEGKSLNQYSIQSVCEAKSILNQLIDHIIKCHDNDIILGDRWPGNTIWDGQIVSLIDFDISYKGRKSSLQVFEHLFALFHHAAIIPSQLNRENIMIPYLFELQERHKKNNLTGVFNEFCSFYSNPRKKNNQTSLQINIYQDILREFATILDSAKFLE